ncbi:unnamed protein product [Cuscuta epithymum]|uniref:Pentatricopeptide repeat-containing protein n=1 Tax=Cuscuta epithymum TaxID=186058 RepID=A0AAV0BVI7_9ASTE|nr:unnamed protein product [Cuscuta epithymum]
MDIRRRTVQNNHKMDIRRIRIPKTTALLFPTKRPLACVISTASSNSPAPAPSSSRPRRAVNPKPHPPPGQQQVLDRRWLTSLLSRPHLEYSDCKQLIRQLTPSQFDVLFSDLSPSSLIPSTALKFFYIASSSCGFQFSVKSYCNLLRLLVASNLEMPARLLLIRLMDGKLHTLFSDPDKKHVEIATTLVDLSGVPALCNTVRIYDLFLHVCCTQFKNAGFSIALDTFQIFAGKGFFPSLKTCCFLLNSLVKANELHKSYQVLDTLIQRVIPDVYFFSIAINALCKGGKVKEAKQLFAKMGEIGVTPNVFVYNNLINGLCKNGELEEAFKLKEEMGGRAQYCDIKCPHPLPLSIWKQAKGIFAS